MAVVRVFVFVFAVGEPSRVRARIVAVVAAERVRCLEFPLPFFALG